MILCFVIAVGFGMSDKPSSTSDYSYFKHAAWNRDLLFNHLDLTNITAVLQDWGGILGLRLAAQHSDRFSRLVIANTVLPTGGMLDADTEAVTEGFFAWKVCNAPTVCLK